jgi:hypothetical protein
MEDGRWKMEDGRWKTEDGLSLYSINYDPTPKT